MNDSFGQFDTSGAATNLQNNGKAWYDAEITHAAVVYEANGQPKQHPKNGKKYCRVDFTVASVLADSGQPEVLTRTYVISYGQSTEGAKPWSAFSQMIAAATGLTCGDPRQKDVGPSHLVGQYVSINPVLNDRGYTDVERVLPIEEAAPTPPTRQAAPQVDQSPQQPRQRPSQSQAQAQGSAPRAGVSPVDRGFVATTQPAQRRQVAPPPTDGAMWDEEDPQYR